MEAVLEENVVGGQVEKALTLFVEAVELSADLEVIGTAFPKSEDEEVFVIRNHSKDEGIEGAYVEVPIGEVVRKVTTMDKAQEFVSVIQSNRKSIVLEGVTRIVGYYSRVNNYNRSKVGELRNRIESRMHGGYGFNGTGVDLNAYGDAMNTMEGMSKLNA